MVAIIVNIVSNINLKTTRVFRKSCSNSCFFQVALLAFLLIPTSKELPLYLRIIDISILIFKLSFWASACNAPILSELSVNYHYYRYEFAGLKELASRHSVDTDLLNLLYIYSDKMAFDLNESSLIDLI